jgi:anti-sigma factor RsiW
MRCDDVRPRLDDLLEGTLPRDERAQVELHLAGCGGCSKELEELTRLLERTAELPREVAPSRDLWPEIAARLEPSRTVVRGRFGTSRWLAVAAAVLAGVGSLLIAYSVGRHQAGPQTAATVDATPLAVPAGLSDTGFAEAESEFRAARDTLLASLANRRGSLSPETLRIVDDNLKVIDDAIERISSALVEDPMNPKLANQLASAYRRQIDLLQRANRLPAET